MSEKNKNTSLIKLETGTLARVSKSLEVTKKLLALNIDPFLIPYRKGDKWGFCLPDRTIVIPCIYECVEFFKKGLAKVKLHNKYGFIDKTGEEIIPYKYDNVYCFREGLSAVELDEKWGYFDMTGKEIISCKYEEANSFNEGLAAVRLNWKFGFIDKTGKEIVPFKYDDCGNDILKMIIDGLCIVKYNEKFGFINLSGKEIVSCKYDFIHYYSDEMYGVNLNEKLGFVNKFGEEVIPCRYENSGIAWFWEGLAAVKLNKKWGYIDKTGNIKIPFKYYCSETRSCFVEGLAGVTSWDKGWGYIDKIGNEITPFKYMEVRPFREGFGAVQINYFEWGFIDKTGNEIIPCKYINVNDFHEGLAQVRLDGKSGFIDQSGHEIISCKYERALDFKEDFAAILTNTKWGFIDKKGIEIIPCKYENAENFSDGLAKVKFIDKEGYINKNGTEYWEEITDNYLNTINHLTETSEAATDIDSNIYNTVKIGTQVWMLENLNVSHFRNGVIIPEAKTDKEWQEAGNNKKPAWCYSDNNPENGKIYGKLYNWYAVNDQRNICPLGWHIPTDAEWTILTTYLGGENVAGGKMKDAGTLHWKSPNTGAYNSSGFKALPGGIRSYYGSFYVMGTGGVWWSSTECSTNNAWYRNMGYSSSYVNRYSYGKANGFSVRCVRDI